MFESSNGDFDIQKEHINGLGEYVITSGFANNGIAGKTNIGAKVFDKNTITIDMFGNAFYRNFKYKMVTHARVFSLKPKFTISERQGIYLANAFHWLPKVFSYDEMCSWEKIKDLTILLPVHNGKIDFDFMELFVTELEARHIAELEARNKTELRAYLTVTGLNDYQLTSDEQATINDLENTLWGGVKIPEIFEVKNTQNILSCDIVENSGTTPYLCASNTNNGVHSYISYNENYKDKGNCIFIGGKTFVVTYQKDDFFSNDSHNLSLILKRKERQNQGIYLFLVTCIKKSLSYKYFWGDSVSKAKIRQDEIYLPTRADNEVYFSDMESLIRVVEKLVIRDVVEHGIRRIEATKQICNLE